MAGWAAGSLGLVLGFAGVEDSAQFSAMVTERVDQSYAGTVLTLQVAIGFTLTVATNWLIPLPAEVFARCAFRF
ncbi:hypothetical protein BG61_37825 [Caballeronia glathei]|uniref:Uncharacterized protein n=1 Tax=Caballeronia glathei TaxID=60547 RepID=A0A069PDF3_9BURK|nr:hypothetical protein BG61_37825 [Caballeronia glathei]